MKWLIGIVMVLAVPGCITTQVANAQEPTKSNQFVSASKALRASEGGTFTNRHFNKNSILIGISSKKIAAEHRTMMMRQQINAQKIDSAVKKLKRYVGKTWYVFSGATPRGWDCSGLTMWAYQQMGISLEHRASKQQHAGHATVNPRKGDIVVFTYKGSKSAYHVGIYLGNGKMIHAGGRRGDHTEVASISKFGGKYSKVTYRHVLT